jgi:hypothetical protein
VEVAGRKIESYVVQNKEQLTQLLFSLAMQNLQEKNYDAELPKSRQSVIDRFFNKDRGNFFTVVPCACLGTATLKAMVTSGEKKRDQINANVKELSSPRPVAKPSKAIKK